ncbi:hypothetical protein BRADI_3g22433v3 [Brachypodium distachyon]|uniref:Uncharacterized protein n=1 Tax=Brachypodium distachyon TaxID=15368 RepID=A0A2K2CYU2_BRADI|nr:hypothetical protein BRADI_3g22433v3 [Brachypodium distachyon]
MPHFYQTASYCLVNILLNPEKGQQSTSKRDAENLNPPFHLMCTSSAEPS